MVDELCKTQAERMDELRQILADHEQEMADDLKSFVRALGILMQATPDAGRSFAQNSPQLEDDPAQPNDAARIINDQLLNFAGLSTPAAHLDGNVKSALKEAETDGSQHGHDSHGHSHGHAHGHDSHDGRLHAQLYHSASKSRMLSSLHDSLHEDHKPEAGEAVLERVRWRVRCIVGSPVFEYAIGAFILANSIIIAAETEFDSGDDAGSRWFTTSETAFLIFYTCEILLKITGAGFSLVWDGWFQFDCAVVLLGYLGKVLDVLGQADAIPFVQQILLIRMLRLLRLIRLLRVISLFKNMWRLIHGLLQSVDTMLSTLGLLLISLFIFACAGVDLIRNDPYLASHDDTKEIVAYSFSSVTVTMLTLIQFVTCDSIAAIYVPLVLHKPPLVIYFGIALLMVPISLMNLVTASIVEGALANAAMDRIVEDREGKQKIKGLLPTLQEIFDQIDTDGSGEITIEEMEAVHVTHLPKEFKDKVSVQNMKDLFEVLDQDGSGKLAHDEFIEGLLNIAFLEVSLPIVQILKTGRRTWDKVLELEAAMSKQ
eukprot:TRINITY_DN42733_c0_g1_i1.p1 TRINITY_DN42733_c0_g1~~TRINITY_DN42733_c0_g1_i1.p1  ORF type:complete len:593 (-),score=97.07 TRINITY_DN42733_c0_g1_i1:247-1875(-)